MSGGEFEYQQYHIGEIADSIQLTLDRMGKEIPKEDRWPDDEWHEKYPEDKFYLIYSDETIKELNNAIKQLRIAHIYAQRVDYLLSGDDSEKDFHKRLNEELNNNNDNGNK
jgi:hypothetical protein